MKYLSFLFIFIATYACQQPKKANSAIGTWNYCTKSGDYEEFIITKEFMLIISTQPKRFFLFKNEVLANEIVYSTIEGEIKLPYKSDTLAITKLSENKIALKSYIDDYIIELNKVEFNFNSIDWKNLTSWKSKIKSDFHKRAELQDCHDLRTEEEKIIPILNLNTPYLLDEEVPMIYQIIPKK